ncbi:hypothetical protein M3J09_001865 [Ascochyta lentis]
MCECFEGQCLFMVCRRDFFEGCNPGS